MTANLDQLDLAGRTPLTPARLSMCEAVARIIARKGAIRQEQLSGIHNPWGHGIALTDPWSFLEVCESEAVVAAAQRLIGPDIILWDSELFAEAGRYGAFLTAGREGRYWPVEPLDGAVLLLDPRRQGAEVRGFKLADISAEALADFAPTEALYVIRVMPATSRFIRDAGHPANRACMEQQVLVNYANRPLWLISGVDRAGNDLVSGFAPAVPIWASADMPKH